MVRVRIWLGIVIAHMDCAAAIHAAFGCLVGNAPAVFRSKTYHFACNFLRNIGATKPNTWHHTNRLSRILAARLGFYRHPRAVTQH